MNEYWDTGFDPLEALIQCQNNIQQCALAINTGSELMKEMGKAYNHQQEVIQQLQFQNRKLTAQINQIQSELLKLSQKN